MLSMGLRDLGGKCDLLLGSTLLTSGNWEADWYFGTLLTGNWEVVI